MSPTDSPQHTKDAKGFVEDLTDQSDDYQNPWEQTDFGQQILYTNDGETATHSVRDGDAVLLPYGYHPVSAPPGYRLCYLWGMAGEQRKLALHEDPAHKWIHEAKL